MFECDLLKDHPLGDDLLKTKKKRQKGKKAKRRKDKKKKDKTTKKQKDKKAKKDKMTCK